MADWGPYALTPTDLALIFDHCLVTRTVEWYFVSEDLLTTTGVYVVLVREVGTYGRVLLSRDIYETVPRGTPPDFCRVIFDLSPTFQPPTRSRADYVVNAFDRGL
jgi:hypothetical protein